VRQDDAQTLRSSSCSSSMTDLDDSGQTREQDPVKVFGFVLARKADRDDVPRAQRVAAGLSRVGATRGHSSGATTHIVGSLTVSMRAH
jgi:hypothetical protein